MPEIQEFSSFGILLHAEIELGWQGFVLVMVGVVALVLLFDFLALRAVRTIRRRRQLSFAERMMKQRTRIVVRLRSFLSRARR
jgi:hypothetical protein